MTGEFMGSPANAVLIYINMFFVKKPVLKRWNRKIGSKGKIEKRKKNVRKKGL
jgi:hypothetical protein